MRILIRTSKWAIWSRRLASLAVPLVVIPVLLHRAGLIEAASFHIAEQMAFGIAVLALVLSVVALARLWHTGDQGWGRAVPAFLISLVCLAPFVWIGYVMWTLPATNDVTTAARAGLPLVMQEEAEDRLPLGSTELARHFPNATHRSYPLDAQQIYDLLVSLVETEGWRVIEGLRPETPGGEGRINATVETLLGWQDEVVLAIAGEADGAGVDGAGVDMRSASAAGGHDLGTNGHRVETFLSTLDTAVTELIRDNPDIIDPVVEPETDAETANPDPA